MVDSRALVQQKGFKLHLLHIIERVKNDCQKLEEETKYSRVGQEVDINDITAKILLLFSGVFNKTYSNIIDIATSQAAVALELQLCTRTFSKVTHTKFMMK